VAILDISMPGKSGLDILDDLKRLRPRLPILLLSMHPEATVCAAEHFKAGAAGYLTKDGVPEELKKPSRNCGRRTLCECDARREARRGIER